eukprot:TRINITY_DN6447_c0_g1_i1.p1 TRINITY_DN6447_c0_g1~~TRINITY_DN6447_c0_g1_i1.p1  ORF type:complete len:129 (+),score=19.57 TRINITY_DN6447_c0_g1_i1:44-430(+)
MECLNAENGCDFLADNDDVLSLTIHLYDECDKFKCKHCKNIIGTRDELANIHPSLCTEYKRFIRICKFCFKTFDRKNNTKCKENYYHPGEININENETYECCKKPKGEPGCQQGKHRAFKKKKKMPNR